MKGSIEMTAKEEAEIYAERLAEITSREATLHKELEELAENWACAWTQLRAAQVAEQIREAERDSAEGSERLDGLRVQSEMLRVDYPDEATMLKVGTRVSGGWENGETVMWASVWSKCTSSWVPSRKSVWEADKGRVGAEIGYNYIHVFKYYPGRFQLMRYQNRLFWVRY
jgi:hypothetical protein